jgi:hypothetical protein
VVGGGVERESVVFLCAALCTQQDQPPALVGARAPLTARAKAYGAHRCVRGMRTHCMCVCTALVAICHIIKGCAVPCASIMSTTACAAQTTSTHIADSQVHIERR